MAEQLDVARRRGQVLEQAQLLEQEQEQEQELVLVLVLVQELVQLLAQRWPHRNPQQQLLVSSWHRASTNLWSFSKRRQKRCASCRQFARQRLLRELQWQTTSPLC